MPRCWPSAASFSGKSHRIWRMTMINANMSERYLEIAVPHDFTTPGYSPPLTDARPRASIDSSLTAFAQLGALRLNARTCIISLLSRDTQYIIAESSKSMSLQDDSSHSEGDGLLFGLTTLPIDSTLCAWSLAHARKRAQALKGLDDGEPLPPFFIGNMAADERFQQHPAVTAGPCLRCYLGVPLISPKTGAMLGSYCILDDKPRGELGESSASFMRDMAKTVMSHLEHARSTVDQGRCEKMVSASASAIGADALIFA